MGGVVSRSPSNVKHLPEMRSRKIDRVPPQTKILATPLVTIHIGSSRLHIGVVYVVYGSSYDNHPLSQKLDPRLNRLC